MRQPCLNFAVQFFQTYISTTDGITMLDGYHVNGDVAELYESILRYKKVINIHITIIYFYSIKNRFNY